MHKNRIAFLTIRWFLSIVFLVSSLIGTAQRTSAASIQTGSETISIIENYPYLRIIQTTEKQLVIEFTPPKPQFENTSINGQNCQMVSIPKLTRLDLPGSPSLPVQGAMVGIPEDAQPTIKVLKSEWSTLPGTYSLCPTPKPVLIHSPQDSWQVTGYSYNYEPNYQDNDFIPSSPALIVSTGNLRSQRYAEIRFNPLQYNPASEEIRYYARIQVAFNFNSLSSYQISPGVYTLKNNAIQWERFFEDTLKSLLLNYEQAITWRHRSSFPDYPEKLESVDFANKVDSLQSSPNYKISINQDGLYQVSYSDLYDAGVPVDSIDPRTFKISNQSIELAIYVEGQADGTFNPGDYLLFYGQKVDSKYTDVNVYWLSWDGSYGLRMASVSGAPSGSATVPTNYITTQHIETDTEYYSEKPSGADKDHWYWGMVSAYNAPAYLDFTTDLHHIDTGSHSITVRGLLNGYYGSPNHHTKIYLNNNLIDDHSFPNGSEYAFTLNTSQSFLLEGTNTLRVECPRDGNIIEDDVLVNWFELDYYDTYFAENDKLFFDGDQAGTWEFRTDGFSLSTIEAYDITNPFSPLRITGGNIQATTHGYRLDFETTISNEHHYLAQTTDQRLLPLAIDQDTPSNWKSSSIGADYIIITHPVFINQVQSLANFRTAQSMRTQVIDVQDLYDEFNGGVFDPEAIKSFLAYAYANWIAPAPSFVLLVGDGNFDFKNVYGDNETNFIPPYLADVDPWLGETASDNRYVSVSGTDVLPDLYIGRFPVRTTAEAQKMVDKTINYEQNDPVGGWNAYQTFIADNADGGGDFPAISDQIINYIPSSYTVDKIYYGINYTTTSTARSAIQAAINSGRLIVHYVGHGSRSQWASEGLLKMTDVAALTNGNKLPFVIPMTCAEGYFIWPSPPGSDYSALGETIVRYNDRGAIASFSPTGYGLSSGHDLLDQSLFNDLFSTRHTQLGYLTTNAKYYLYAQSSAYHDLIETYLLFGDPALYLQVLPVELVAPNNLQANTISSTQIDLIWQDNSSDETEFRIERSPDGSTNWQQIAVVAANVTRYSNTNLSCDTTYYYRVRAYRLNDDQFSDYSNVANASTYACQALIFNPGWNLITLPLVPVNSFNAETLLLSINSQSGACSEINQWVNGGWNSHSLGLPFGQFNIAIGEGYFVKCTQTSNWNLEGNRLTNGITLNLIPGWNLVGIPYPKQGLSAQTVLDGIKAQSGSCSEIVRWINGGWETHTDGLPYNNFSILPAEGYFIQCSGSSSYTP